MEVSALKHHPFALRGPAPLLRLASDEQLVALIRRGQHSAFEALVGRYQSRLLGFCRHMLRSQEDAEDVLQEVFAASFNALLADEREINVRPWLYRIARNRCLNHMRRNTAVGVDSMDVLFADNGQSTVEKVTRREDFRLLLADISRLPETQRTAIVLREMDALSYEQIAEAMDTTVPGVKSLLVRARVSLAEAGEARKLSCDEVRLELAAIAEGIASITAPFRRHVKQCERCTAFRRQLRADNRAMAIALPIGPMILLKKVLLTKVGISFGSGGASATGAGAAAGAGAGVTGTGAAGALTAGALSTKAVAGLAAAALVTAGAVEVRPTATTHRAQHPVPTTVAALPQRSSVPRVVSTEPQPVSTQRAARTLARPAAKKKPRPVPVLAAAPKPTKPKPPAVSPVKAPVAPPAAPTTTQQVSARAVLPPEPPTTKPTSAPAPLLSTTTDTPPPTQPTPASEASPPPPTATTTTPAPTTAASPSSPPRPTPAPGAAASH